MKRFYFGLTIGALAPCMAGCNPAAPPPGDQFKVIADAKKSQLVQFFESKQSRLSKYEATVSEEPNADKRSEATHIGIIEFKYPVTKPSGPAKIRTLNTAVAEYRFSTKEKKWVFKDCSLKLDGDFLVPKEGPLVTFPEVKAVFEK